MSNESILVRAALTFLPVILFLIAFYLLDSHRLVRPRRVLLALLSGGVAALLGYVVNTALLDLSGMPTPRFAVLVAPVVEELIKALYVGWLIRTRRIGFLIDGAILGFAAGAGFGIAENVYYMRMLPEAPLLVWIIRGLGTAIMHGGATAILAVVLLGFGGQGARRRPWLGALAAAALFHGAFNRFMTSPIPTTGVMLVVLPLVLYLAYWLGERRLQRWIGFGFDRDSELLSLIRSGAVSETPLGRYLQSLREGLRPDAVADMLCLLRLQCELNLRAKGMLMLREHDLEPEPDPDLPAKLDEVRWLERSIGRTGLLAMRPVCRWRSGDRWQRHLMEDEAG